MWQTQNVQSMKLVGTKVSRTRSHWTKFDMENKTVLKSSQLPSSCLWANQKSCDILNVVWSSENINKAKSLFPRVKIA